MQGLLEFKDVTYSQRTPYSKVVSSDGREIPENVKKIFTDKVIEKYAFENHIGLINVIIPPNKEEIQHGAFCGCGNLKSVELPEGLTILGDEAFGFCTSLTSIRIPVITYIGCGAFVGCTGLTNVTFAEELSHIGTSTFSHCTQLREVVLPTTVYQLEQTTFAHCVELRKVVLPNGLLKIDSGVFENCYSSEEISIPDSVTYIGKSAFYRCENLTNITIPKNVKEICEITFDGCTRLESITLPHNLTKIGVAFQNCRSLKNVYYNGTEKDWKLVLVKCKKIKKTKVEYLEA